MKRATERSGERPTARTWALASAAWLVLVFAGASWVGLGAVRAQVAETLFELGAHAMSYPGTEGEEARAVELNGVRVFLRTQLVHASLNDVLSHYQGVCAGRGEASFQSRLLSSLATRVGKTSRDGYVACVNLAVDDVASLVRRGSSFAASWDLADIGFPRYAYARRVDDTRDDRTHVVTMWSDDSLALRHMLPLGGKDASGQDPRDLDRPRGSQRLLFARETAASTALYVYRIRNRASAELAKSHRRMLRHRGWRIVERHPAESVAFDGVRQLSAEKAGRLVTAVFRDEPTGSMLLTLLTSGAAD